MAQRSKASSRRDADRHDSDPFAAIKPLIVLALLGTILYGAYSVIRRGPSGGAGGSAVVPALAQTAAPQAAEASPLPPAPPAPPSVQVASQATAAPPPVPPALPAAASPPAQVLKAVSESPPVEEVAVQQAPEAAAGAIAAVPASPQRQSAAFAAAWADAHDKLAAARYAEALGILSGWYDDPSLAPEEGQRLEELLGQLAGTVIYSPQDHLLPPHIVAAGETLRDIAGPLNVPWQLLAKINGVEAPARLVPGEPLKVVQGPFDAAVSLSRGRLSLQLKGSYAGSFAVVVGRQLHERIGSSLAVERVRRGGPKANATPSSGPVRQASHEEDAEEKRILLDGGFSIDAVDDPVTAADSASGTALLVAPRDLDELVDILGSGSRIYVKP